MSLASMCRTRVTLERQTSTKDPSGGPLQTFRAVPAATDVPCDIQPASAQVQQRYLRNDIVVDYTVFLTADIGALSSDRLSDSNGIKYLLVEGGYMAGATGYPLWPAVAHVKRLT